MHDAKVFISCCSYEWDMFLNFIVQLLTIVTVWIKVTPFTLDSNLLKNFSAYYVQRSMLDIGISKKCRDLSLRTYSLHGLHNKRILAETIRISLCHVILALLNRLLAETPSTFSLNYLFTDIWTVNILGRYN